MLGELRIYVKVFGSKMNLFSPGRGGGQGSSAEVQNHLRFEGHGDSQGHGQGHDQGNCQLHGDSEGCLIMVLQAART